jgi:tRNA(Ile)-lysidine synthetase-like protein
MRAALLSEHAARVMDDYVETDADWLRRAPAAMLPDLVQGWMKEAGLWRKMLSAKDYERIAALLERGRGRVAISGAALACVWRGLFILCPTPAPAEQATAEGGCATPAQTTPAKAEYGVRLAAPGRTFIEPLRGWISGEMLGDYGKNGKYGKNDGTVELLDFDSIELPLIARFPRAGDRMRALGAPGSRKLQDIFTDLHVPPWLRSRTLLVTMSDRPIWIVGQRIADAVKLTNRTRRVLRLSFEGE